jgi:hypothetical protein
MNDMVKKSPTKYDDNIKALKEAKLKAAGTKSLGKIDALLKKQMDAKAKAEKAKPKPK